MKIQHKTTIAFLSFLLVVISGCTTTQEIKRLDGQKEYLVACGASTGWNICYKKANELCPNGYKVLDKDAGFNRKELYIFCPSLPGKATRR